MLRHDGQGCVGKGRAGTSIFGDVRLVMLSQVGLLPETLSTQSAPEGLLPGVRPDMDVDRVPIFKALVAQVAVVQKSRFLLRLIRLAAGRLELGRGGCGCLNHTRRGNFRPANVFSPALRKIEQKCYTLGN